MDIASRIGPRDADVIVFNKGGRDFRYERLMAGEETPREFFYGYFDLEKSSIRAAMISSAGAVPGGTGAVADFIERGAAYLTALGVRPLSARLAASGLRDARALISYTDGFSLSLGLGLPRRKDRPALIGGFHALSDIEERVRPAARPLAHHIIRRCLAGLDHLFFFGPADRAQAIRMYGLDPERCSVFPFGVDTEFWHPAADVPPSDFVIAVGQDPNRDYPLLVAAPGQHPTVIITRQALDVPRDAGHVRITAGDFFGSDWMSDADLRRVYNQSRAVIVPLKDVYQPTGYSVTLQAMSCGRPVILSNIRGLWAPDLLRDGENCLLVPPGDAAALGAAIGRVRSDPAFAARLGNAARATAIEHFGLDMMGAGTVALAKRGLALRSHTCAGAA
jgi:glycosyltransferase involved in cell wall biosynthesis